MMRRNKGLMIFLMLSGLTCGAAYAQDEELYTPTTKANNSFFFIQILTRSNG